MSHSRSDEGPLSFWLIAVVDTKTENQFKDASFVEISTYREDRSPVTQAHLSIWRLRSAFAETEKHRQRCPGYSRGAHHEHRALGCTDQAQSHTRLNMYQI